MFPSAENFRRTVKFYAFLGDLTIWWSVKQSEHKPIPCTAYYFSHVIVYELAFCRAHKDTQNSFRQLLFVINSVPNFFELESPDRTIVLIYKLSTPPICILYSTGGSFGGLFRIGMHSNFQVRSCTTSAFGSIQMIPRIFR